VTTLKSNGKGKVNGMKGKESPAEQAHSQKTLLKGLAASPGVASGKVKLLGENDSLDIVLKDDILVTVMTSPDMVPAMIARRPS
jgi:pyruvate,water dikinase